MKICKEIDCENKHYAKGWCENHYRRWLKYGPNIVKIEHHGYSRHHLYGVWRNMKDRCYNRNNKYYKDYGNREIIICDEWKNDIKVFIEWALPLWKEGLEIDRINNDGNYGPKNCRFVTSLENSHNQRLLMKTNTSGYRGVYYRKDRKKWEAQITINNKNKYLGLFDSAKEAALAYDNVIPDNRPRNFIKNI